MAQLEENDGRCDAVLFCHVAKVLVEPQISFVASVYQFKAAATKDIGAITYGRTISTLICGFSLALLCQLHHARQVRAARAAL